MRSGGGKSRVKRVLPALRSEIKWSSGEDSGFGVSTNFFFVLVGGKLGDSADLSFQLLGKFKENTVFFKNLRNHF